ncbi:hypothetical protein CANINC_002659 [Pichia inconspicua]|uniref:Arrestin-like N-terminal domain-containing protein n=1 Tax=Pichia inconspicua TaxID=52247 RepID=A0A4T0X0J9_9ASCO|nr:hypothetical protein CANINC_002659 [[Candida] inconspicua]
MSRFFAKSIDIDIKIDDPPPYNKYSPANSVVKGMVKIDFQEPTKKISYISCGIQGKALMTYYATDYRVVGLKTTRTKRRIVQQNIDFFNMNVGIPLNVNEEIASTREDGEPIFNFNAGDHLESGFRFKFPLNQCLPSSTKSYGSIDAEVKITYELYVEVFKVSKFFSRTRSYQYDSQRILFQSGADPRISKNLQTLQYLKNELFKDKLKKFYFDKDNNALIPNSMSKSHSKTKFIRKLWDDNYKTENYSMNTKTIPLSVNFEVESPLDLEKPFSSQLSLHLSSDLKSVEINSNQTTDFVFNGQSTGLGLIKIESLKIETRNSMTLQHHHFVMREDFIEPIIKIQFEGLSFDIKDFDYNKVANLFEKEIDIESLVEAADHDLNLSLIDLIGKGTIMCTGTMESWLQNVVQLTFVWKISDGNGSNSKRVEFQTTSTPDFLLGMSQRDPQPYSTLSNVALPPPTYEMSKEDASVVVEPGN